MSQITHKILDNGVEVLLKESHFSQAVAIQCWVGVGSIHESEHQRGMAHYLEHMLFKGTQKHGVGEIAAIVEGCGGDINAYTTFDHTVFYLTLASPHALLGVELLADSIGYSSLDPEEFAKEREVILEEIRRGNDSPGHKVGRKIFERVFANTEAGRPIIGSTESGSGFSREAVYEIYRHCYQPENLKVVVVGDFASAVMLKKIEETFGAMENARQAAQLEMYHKETLHTINTAVDHNVWTKPEVQIIRGDYQQPRLEIVFKAPHSDHFDSIPLDLVAFALGAGDMSRLNRKLRDQRGVVTHVGASVYSPKFGGIFEVSAYTAPELIVDALAGLAGELATLYQHEPVTEDELQRARANLKVDKLYKDETVDGQARTLGSSLRSSFKVLFEEAYAASVNAMQVTLVDAAVKRWLNPQRVLIVALLPENSELTEDTLRATYVNALEKNLNSKTIAAMHGAASQISARLAADALREATTLVQINEGLKLVYRRNEETQLFTATLASEGGLRAEIESNAGLFNAMTSMLATATQKRSYESLINEVESRGASLEGFSGKDSFGFHMQCLVDYADFFVSLLAECLLEPKFEEDRWAIVQREVAQALVAQDDSPAGICVRQFQKLVLGQHPYRFPSYGHKDSFASLSMEMVYQSYLDYRDQGPWVLSAVGSEPVDVVVSRISKHLGGFKPTSKQRSFASEQWVLDRAAQPGSDILHKEREQAHVTYGFIGTAWHDRHRAALDVLTNILGGHGGRLFLKLRDQESLAYTVSPILSYGCHPGLVGAYIACAPSKIEAAVRGLKREILALKHEPVTENELIRAKNYIIGSHDMSLQRSDAQTSTMALMELYGYGYDDFVRYPERVARVTVKDIQEVAQRFFDDEHAVTVVVKPEKG